MTYYDIVKQALAHLEYGTDEDSVATFIDRFMIYANDAVRKIAIGLKMEKAVGVQVEDGAFYVPELYELNNPPIQLVKIVEVMRNGINYPFVQGVDDQWVEVSGKDGIYGVRFRYVPDYESDPTQTPAIPALFHPIIYLYVVHCHHNTRSTASDYDRTKWLQEFETERKRLTRQAYSVLNTFAWKNRPWETGEM